MGTTGAICVIAENVVVGAETSSVTSGIAASHITDDLEISEGMRVYTAFELVAQLRIP